MDNVCEICPRECGVSRENKSLGFCAASKRIKIAWYGKHFGEEPPISGTNGSGAVFFSHCNLRCCYCQNFQISRNGFGKEYGIDDFVRIMLNLEKQGAHNINLVTPSIWARQIKEAIIKARGKGLKIPIVYNTNGYEKIETLKELEGLIEIYLPDYKYADDKLAVKYSSAPNYSTIAKKAILEMQKQVGDLRVDDKGVAERGLIIRHLILPSQMQNTFKCLEFIRSVSENVYISLLTQYAPVYDSRLFPEINRFLSQEEFESAMIEVNELNFNNGWVQEFGPSCRCFLPDFTKTAPFGK